jgi:hypothetical protein
MNYGTNEAMTIQMTIKFDNANQKGANAGIGSAVTRTIGTNATGVGS